MIRSRHRRSPGQSRTSVQRMIPDPDQFHPAIRPRGWRLLVELPRTLEVRIGIIRRIGASSALPAYSTADNVGSVNLGGGHAGPRGRTGVLSTWGEGTRGLAAVRASGCSPRRRPASLPSSSGRDRRPLHVRAPTQLRGTRSGRAPCFPRPTRESDSPRLLPPRQPGRPRWPETPGLRSRAARASTSTFRGRVRGAIAASGAPGYFPLRRQGLAPPLEILHRFPGSSFAPLGF
jgi:hypothetical protein